MTSLEQFTRTSAKRYLQNIVWVDDEIYERQTQRPAEIKTLMPSFKSPFAGGSNHTEAPVPTGNSEASIFHPKDLMESFAREGIICALYEPAEGFDTSKESIVYKLCERADAVLFDWDLFGEDGANILSLLSNLVDDSQHSHPHQVRLCVIYTTKPDLSRVANSVYEYLLRAKLKVDPVETQYALNAGATRIVILGKPDVTGRPEASKNLEVAEKDLANRVIDEFAKMNTGILPAYALHGISAIRRNSKKILDKFQAEMDGAFLLHRALIINSEDAFDQLPELLAEEALAVMLDEQISNENMVELTKSAVAELPFQQLNFNLKRQDEYRDTPLVELIKIFLTGGMPAIKGKFKFDSDEPPVQALHKSLGCNESLAQKKLASLFSNRTKYFTSKLPALTFGTIVRHQENGDWQYAFCLMPICDSIRLKSGEGYKTSFPFWSLKPAKKKENGKGIIVATPEGIFVDLMASGKPKDMLWLEEFSPSPAGLVVGAPSQQVFEFSGNKRTLQWVSQLKPSHAQRIANDIGQSFSRVGVSEAEWVRLLVG